MLTLKVMPLAAADETKNSLEINDISYYLFGREKMKRDHARTILWCMIATEWRGFIAKDLTFVSHLAQSILRIGGWKAITNN